MKTCVNVPLPPLHLLTLSLQLHTGATTGCRVTPDQVAVAKHPPHTPGLIYTASEAAWSAWGRCSRRRRAGAAGRKGAVWTPDSGGQERETAGQRPLARARAASSGAESRSRGGEATQRPRSRCHGSSHAAGTTGDLARPGLRGDRSRGRKTRAAPAAKKLIFCTSDFLNG